MTKFDEFISESLNNIYLIDEKLKRRKKVKTMWKGYKKRRNRKASIDKDFFSQYRNIKAELKSLNPYNVARLTE